MRESRSASLRDDRLVHLDARARRQPGSGLVGVADSPATQHALRHARRSGASVMTVSAAAVTRPAVNQSNQSRMREPANAQACGCRDVRPNDGQRRFVLRLAPARPLEVLRTVAWKGLYPRYDAILRHAGAMPRTRLPTDLIASMMSRPVIKGMSKWKCPTIVSVMLDLASAALEHHAPAAATPAPRRGRPCCC
jgi:hypothetical protein